MPVIQLSADSPSAPKISHCVVAGATADHIQIGPTGGLVVAGDGDDVVRGSSLRDTVLGDDGDDELLGALGSDHLDGGFGRDRIEGGDSGDFILGGPGDDTIYGEQAEGTPARPGRDIIHGGSGADTIYGGPGADELYGGLEGDSIFGGEDEDTIIGAQGDDQLHGDGSGDWLSGGAGNDTIHGGPGGDSIHPGMGRDSSYGGDGNDTFIINSECELQPGEIIDGGLGADRVLSPLTEDELIARGVKLVSIETFTRRWRGEVKPGEVIGSTTVCRFQDPAVEIIEVSGSVVETDVLWQDGGGLLHDQDGKRHPSWDIVTRHHLQIDTVYDGALDEGDTITIVLAGGTIEMDDGTGTSQSGCCFTVLEAGRRYRLVLREMRAKDGSSVGWEYEWLVESPPNHSLVLRLGDRGPISLAMNDLLEYDEPPCPKVPIPGQFSSKRKSIKWARALERRWDQDTDLCGGGVPCYVAAPRAFMDHNMTLPEGCNEPETFGFVFGDAATVMSNGGIIDGTWGVHPPGTSTNPALLTACDSSDEEDGRSCIALDIPRADLGGASHQRNIGGLNAQTETQFATSAKSMAWPTLKEITEVDITFKHDLDYGDVCEGLLGNFSFSPLATHELGHAFGLAHADDECPVNMFESQVARWGAHERARFRVLYPSHEYEFPDNLYVE